MTSQGAPGVVLVADGDAMFRRRLEAALLERGLSVLVARDGNEAWRLVEAKAPPLVLLGWKLPGLDGPELCRRIRGRGASATTHVILLVTRAERRQLVEALDAGADDYVAKPFVRADLHARLRVAERAIALRHDLLRQVAELEAALSGVAPLRGALSICAYCRRVRDGEDCWSPLEDYLTAHAEVQFNHGICPDCFARAKEDLARRRLKR
jgi:sigma-B regulation protein RsbU (phosphoserine phosphatase)